MLKSFEYVAAPKFDVLLTADQAYPVLEREFLHAQSEIWAGFRVFDLTTLVRSVAAKRVAETWFDLVIHTLSRGVAINIVISDFDPVARPSLHRGTWRSVRRLIAAAELAGASDRLHVTAAMHPARTGLLPRLLFWPAILHRQFKAARWLNLRPKPERLNAIREMPGLAEHLVTSANGRVRPKLWPIPALHPATHHQKMAVFDRKTLYLGGLDLDERRFDTPAHDRNADETWHDVQLTLSGPAVPEAQSHLESFLDVTAGRRQPARQRRFLRTLSRPHKNNLLHFGPEPVVEEIAVAHEHYAKRARRLIYLETQYFRDLHFARYLARRASENPGLSMLLVLPGAPEEIAFERRIGLDARFGEFLQARALRILVKAFGKRLFIAGMAQPRRTNGGNENGRALLHGAPIVYIHSKVSVFDDSAAIISSANLNGRSLRWDTEAGLLLTDKNQVQILRRKVMGHWLPDGAHDGYFDPGRAVSAWRALALANVRKEPDQREGFLLPYDIKAAERDATEVPVVPPEMV
ncbi:phospholipase D-like domain-containing protein [Defluviimonas aestuarii]|uniref:phospholipase D-like domain-containing protein n=1 Tax=Albidovulum aestuarii TaxID=1130726 RepID=UPI00249CF3B8|nr:phospholipase D-like domain-containing protein [Defluviimonas aestuarii]MDI3335561.1 phospholipase D-like domain-containing protein [Defluviimonas aestuarii]